jgi:hypothetical protein
MEKELSRSLQQEQEELKPTVILYNNVEYDIFPDLRFSKYKEESNPHR